ncbi:hypothetical protein ACUVO0_005035, partial [Escherichia coli]
MTKSDVEIVVSVTVTQSVIYVTPHAVTGRGKIQRKNPAEKSRFPAWDPISRDPLIFSTEPRSPSVQKTKMTQRFLIVHHEYSLL